MGERRPKGIPMKRPVLDLTQTAWLAATFDRNRALFGGARMMADDEGAAGGDAEAGSDKDAGTDKGVADKPSGDEPLGEGGKKAIEAEREARKVAQDEAKALKGEFGALKDALAEAFGIKPKEGDDGNAVLTAVQKQLADMQHEAAVLKLANEHKITDATDLELLATAKDADALKKLAERLAPKEQDGDAKSPRKPKPDRGQGGSGGSGTKSVAQVMADRRAAREKNQT